MNRKNLLKVSYISFGISAFVFIFNYFFYHYFTAEGFTPVYHKLPQKPFVADLIGQFAVLFLFAGVMTLIFALVCYKKDTTKKD